MTIEARYTTTTGPGDAVAQAHPSGSLGGYASTTAWVGGIVGDLFGPASSVDAAAGRPDYRCLYLYNPDAPDVAGLRVYVLPATAGGVLAAGADPRPVTHVDSLSPQAVDVASGYAAPAGVTFAAPTDYASGVAIGDLPGETPSTAGAGRALWLRRTPSATPAALAEACDLVAATAAGVVWTRRVYWQVEPPVPGLAPPATVRLPPAVPTPAPFVRLAVDYLTVLGARVTWALDSTLRDAGPYDFQLQTSRSGVPTAADWTDVGHPVRDALALYDTGRTLWGMTTDRFYRVVLTTATATHVSRPAAANGVMGKRDWLHVQEVVRKERLYQRELVGVRGFLLRSRRYGTRCSCVNQTTGEVNNSSCPVCYGTGVVGGYHDPVATALATTAPESADERVAYNESLGTVKPVTTAARMVADLVVASRDAWASEGSDERYYVHSVAEVAAWMSVPVVYRLELRLAPRSDVLYDFPLVRPADDDPAWRRAETVSV